MHPFAIMSKKLKLLTVMLLVVTVLAVHGVTVGAQVDIPGHNAVDQVELQKRGLSQRAVAELTSLNNSANRKRPVVVNQTEVLKMLDAGFPEDVIRLFIGLDWSTGDEEAIPITPAQAMELAATGVSLETIRIMLAGEMARASSQESISHESDIPVAENISQPPDRDEKRVAPPIVSEGGTIRLGRQVVTHPDGRQEVIYSSPFSAADSGLGRKEVTDADGSKAIVYYSVGAGNGQDILDERTRRDLRYAMELLEKINCR